MTSEILKAVQNKQASTLRSLLLRVSAQFSNEDDQQGAMSSFLDKECVNDQHQNVLYIACSGGDLECTTILVESGATIRGSHCIHIAAQNGHHHIVGYLIREHGADVSEQDSQQNTPFGCAFLSVANVKSDLMLEFTTALRSAFMYQYLHHTLPKSDSSLVRRLCQHPQQQREGELKTLLADVETRDDAVRGILVACAHGNLWALTVLVSSLVNGSNGDSQNVLLTHDEHGWNALHFLIGRSAVCPPEEYHTLREMASLIISKNEKVLYQSACGDDETSSLSLRSPLLHRLFTGMMPVVVVPSQYSPRYVETITSSSSFQTNFTFYVRHALLSEEDDVVRFGAWIWVNNDWGKRYEGVLTFWPRSGRRIVLSHVDEDGPTYDCYYDDKRDEVRSNEDKEVILRPTPTCLPCLRENIPREIAWKIPSLPSCEPFEFVRLVSFSIHKECYKVVQQGVMRTLIIVRGGKSCFADGSAPANSFDGDFHAITGTVCGSLHMIEITPMFIPSFVGGNPVSWIMRGCMEHWYPILPSSEESTKKLFAQDPVAREDVLHSVARVRWSESTDALSKKHPWLQLLKWIGVVVSPSLQDVDHEHHNVSQPSRFVPSSLYLAIVNESDPNNAKTTLTELGILQELDDKDASKLHRKRKETVLLEILHNACAVGGRSKVERIIRFLKSNEDVWWKENSLLNRGLQVRYGEMDTTSVVTQYAVGVAAQYGHTRVLLVLQNNGADMMVADGIALRKAIQHKQYATATWIVQNGGWSGNLQRYPSTELQKKPMAVSMEEIQFCMQHNLLRTQYYEEYILTSTEWEEEDDEESTSSKAAIVLVNPQNEFFLPYGMLALPNADEMFARKVSEFLTDWIHHVARVIVVCAPNMSSYFQFTKTHRKVSVFDLNGIEDSSEHGLEVHPTLQKALDALPKSKVRYVKGGADQSTLVHAELQDARAEHTFVLGFATDVCVGNIALDTLALGYDVTVVTDLSQAISDTHAQPILESIKSSGGFLQTSEVATEEFKRDEIAATSFNAEHAVLVKELFGVNKLRYRVVLGSRLNSPKLLTALNRFDFGFNNPREGELYLYLCSLLCEQNSKVSGFRIHGLWLERGQHVVNDSEPFEFPLHYLMMTAKYGSSASSRKNAQDLLVNVIKFINQSFKTRDNDMVYFGKDKAGKNRTLERIAVEVPPLCEANDVTKCRCIFHINSSTSSSSKRDQGENHPLLSRNMYALHEAMGASPPPFHNKFARKPTCSVGFRSHTFPTPAAMSGPNADVVSLQHVLSCTPLTLAVRLRLSTVIRTMVCSPESPPVVYEKVSSGKDDNGERFTLQEYHDLWNAKPKGGDVAANIAPAFHFLLRSSRSVKSDWDFDLEDKQIVETPECDEHVSVQTAPPNFIHGSTNIFHPGCGAKSKTIEEIAEAAKVQHAIQLQRLKRGGNNDSLDSSSPDRRVERKKTLFVLDTSALDVDENYGPVQNNDSASWSVPCGLQWLCPECGCYFHECYDVRDVQVVAKLLEITLPDTIESLVCCRAFLEASTLYEREITINGVKRDSVQVRGELHSRYIDICGLYQRSGWTDRLLESDHLNNTIADGGNAHPTNPGDSGVSLLFQFMPDMLNELVSLGILKRCMINKFTVLNDLVQKSNCSVLVRRRHLWSVAHGGVQILVYDRGLSFLQFCALLNLTELTKWILAFPDFNVMDELPSERLGYYALHFAAFGCSVDVMKLLVNHVARTKTQDFLTRYVNRAALPGFDEGTLTYGQVFDGIESDVSLQLKTINREVDPSAYPYANKDEIRNKGVAPFFYGKMNSLGETALHVVASFGHMPCLDFLLQNKADTSLKTALEGLDAHDIAIALQHRFEMQEVESILRGDESSLVVEHIHNHTNNLTEKLQAKMVQDRVVLDDVVRKLNETEEVRSKFTLFGSWQFVYDHALYLLFITCLVVYTFMFNDHAVTTSRPDFLANQALRNLLEGATFPLDYLNNDSSVVGSKWKTTIYDMDGADNIAAWIRGPLRNLLFSKGENPNFHPSFRRIGAVRVSQMQVKNISCAKVFVDNTRIYPVPGCYPRWSEDANDKQPSPTGDHNFTIWSGTTLDRPSIKSEIRYPLGEGYVLDLRASAPFENTTLDDRFDDLKTFFNSKTRKLSVVFSVYALNINRFVAVEIEFELLAEGGTTISLELTPLSLSAQNTIFTQILFIGLILSVVWLGGVEITDGYYTFKDIMRNIRNYKYTLAVMYSNDESRAVGDAEILVKLTTERMAFDHREKLSAKFLRSFMGSVPTCTEVLRQGTVMVYLKWTLKSSYMMVIVANGVVGHLVKSWNGVDLTVILLLVVSFLYDGIISRSPIDVSNVFHEIYFVDFVSLASAWRMKNICLSTAVLFSILTLFKCAHYIPKVGPYASAIVGTMGTREVITYAGILFLTIIAFFLCMTNGFGYRLNDYRSVHSSFFRVLLWALGNTDYDNLFSTHYTLGPFIFIFGVAFINILLMNTFIAVVGQVYGQRLENANAVWAQSMVRRYREVMLDLPALDHYSGDIFTHTVGLLGYLCIPPIGPTLKKWRANVLYKYYKGKIHVVHQPSYKVLPHLSPWNCISQPVNDIILESQRSEGTTNEDLLKELDAVKEVLINWRRNNVSE